MQTVYCLLLAILITSPQIFAKEGEVWTSNMKKLYTERKFVELEQIFIIHGQSGLAESTRLQSKDLFGCKFLHEGIGQESSLQSCLSFLIRENEMKIKSPKRRELVTDMNFICEKFAERKGFVNRILNSNIKMKNAEWAPCSNALWKQIFLTIYAKFQINPVSALSVLRQAEMKLSPSPLWHKKIKEVLAKR